MEPQIRLRLNVLFKETKTNLAFNEKPEAKQVLRTKMKENPLERETGMRTKNKLSLNRLNALLSNEKTQIKGNFFKRKCVLEQTLSCTSMTFLGND